MEYQEKLGIGICVEITTCYLGMRYYILNFRVRKRYGIKKMTSDNNFTTAVEMLNKLPRAIMTHAITRAGKEAIVTMHNRKGTLNSLGYKTFCKNVLVSNKVLEAKSLPPTSAAAKYTC